MNPPTFVFYHRDADGFASACCARWALGEAAVTFQGVQHREPVPAVPDGAEVYVLDFAFSAEVLAEWMGRGCRVTVLDHHQSAQMDLANLLGVTTHESGGRLDVRVDLEKAGCEMAWEYFAPRFPAGALLRGRPFPWLLQAVADQDLWRFKHADTGAIMASLDLEEWDFAKWEALCLMGPGDEARRSLIAAGESLLRYRADLARRQAKRWHWLELRGGVKVAAVNCTALFNETAEALRARVLADTTKAGEGIDPEVTACYSYAEGGFRFALRSDGRVDVSAIAARYGGGGHKNAAGFFVEGELPDFRDTT